MMKNKMRICSKRIIVCCLLLTMLIGNLPISVFATNSDYQKHTMTLNSNVVSYTGIALYAQENTFYIPIEDMAKLTRCEISTDGDCVTVKQGFNTGTFDYTQQLYIDLYNNVEVRILQISPGEYAVPAVMFLNYFGATAYIDGETLFVLMPVCTAWEALDIDYTNTSLNISDMYDNVEAHLWIDLINEFIIGDLQSEYGYMLDAYDAVMEVKMEENEAV